MPSITIKRLAVPAAVSLALAGLALAPSPGVARELPPGCNLGIQQETVGAPIGHTTTFQFNGYNALPFGHKATDVVISWGDGTRSGGSAKTRATPFAPGCYQTVFTGRHRYAHVSCAGGTCSSLYNVTIRYEDAHTHAKHTLTQLSVDIFKPAK